MNRYNSGITAVFLSFLSFLFISSNIFNENLNSSPGTAYHAADKPPEISNVSAARITSKLIRIVYDLNDPENKPMQVFIKISSDSGKTYSVSADSVKGEVGYPVYSGSNKEILVYITGLPGIIYKIKIAADDKSEVFIKDIADKVDSTRILNSIRMMQGIRHFAFGYLKWQAAKDTIHNRFIAAGLQTHRHDVPYNIVHGENIIGRKTGHISDSSTYAVFGHFDTTPNTPGADDNASGTVGMLEAMRVLSQYNFEKSLNFIGFDLEEVPGGLYGSRLYVQNGIKPYEKYEGVINLEMIGYYCFTPNCQSYPSYYPAYFPSFVDSINAAQRRGDFIMNAGNVNSNSLKTEFDNCALLYAPGLRVLSIAAPGNGTLTPDLRRSDHANFWDHNIKAIMLTDFYNFRNPYYHTMADTAGTLNIGILTKVVKATVAALAKLAVVRNIGIGFTGFIGPEILPIQETEINVPSKFHLSQNYPNPFNPATTIKFGLPAGSETRIIIYDLNGKEVRVLVNENLKAGSYEVVFDAGNLASGVYFYKITAGNYFNTKKMILVK